MFITSIYFVGREHTCRAGVEMREQFGGVLSPPREPRQQAPLPTRPSHWSKKGFKKKKIAFILKKIRKKQTKTPLEAC